MKCSVCGSTESKVVDSRPRETYVFRRRECLGCGERVSTKEFSPAVAVPSKGLTTSKGTQKAVLYNKADLRVIVREEFERTANYCGLSIRHAMKQTYEKARESGRLAFTRHDIERIAHTALQKILKDLPL